MYMPCIRRQTISHPPPVPLTDSHTLFSDWLMLWISSLFRLCINVCYWLSTKPCFLEKLLINSHVTTAKESVCTDLWSVWWGGERSVVCLGLMGGPDTASHWLPCSKKWSFGTRVIDGSFAWWSLLNNNKNLLDAQHNSDLPKTRD